MNLKSVLKCCLFRAEKLIKTNPIETDESNGAMDVIWTAALTLTRKNV